MFKKILYTLLFFTLPSFAIEYSSIIEPYQKYILKSDVSGKVIFSSFEKELSVLEEAEILIEIDATKEKIKLKAYKQKYSNTLDISHNLEKNYLTVSASKNKSDYEKRIEYLNLLNTKNNLFDLKLQIEDLEDTIQRKQVSIPPNMYLNKIYVYKDDYISPNNILLDYYDISKQKINVYVLPEDYLNIKSNDSIKIFINNKLSDFKINKISIKKDDNKLSTYLLELINNNPNNNSFSFGEAVIIEFK